MSSATRRERMVLATPDYYHYSKIFKAVQQAIADDIEAVDAGHADLITQLYIPTATWGLKYWEEILSIVKTGAETYDTRRSRVLARWRGIGNFSAALIKNIAAAFTTEQINVLVVVSEFLVILEVPVEMPSIDVFKAEVDNIIHAHLGVRYRSNYHFTAHNGITNVVSMLLSGKWSTRFWNKEVSKDYRWNGVYSFDAVIDPTKQEYWNGNYSFNGAIDLSCPGMLTFGAEGMTINQQHTVKIYPVTRVMGKGFSSLTQLWDGHLTFGSCRTFGDFTPDGPAGTNSVRVTEIKNGIVQGVAAI